MDPSEASAARRRSRSLSLSLSYDMELGRAAREIFPRRDFEPAREHIHTPSDELQVQPRLLLFHVTTVTRYASLPLSAAFVASRKAFDISATREQQRVGVPK